MLVIRKNQMSAFSQYMVRQFESSVLAYLHAMYPQYAKEKGTPYLQSLIRSGIEKAAGYAIYVEDDVRCFIECMIVFGADFDTSQTWAGESLGDQSIAGDEKTRRLKKHLDQSMEVR